MTLNSSQREDIFKQDPVKSKTTKDKKQNQEPHVIANKNKKNNKPIVDIPKSEPNLTLVPPPEQKVVIEVIPAVAVPQTNGVVVNTGKEKKKKKSEFNTKQQLSEQILFS